MVECLCADSQFSSVVPEWDKPSRGNVLLCRLARGVLCIRRGRRRVGVPWEWELRGLLRRLLQARVQLGVRGDQPSAQGSAMFHAE